MAKTDFLKLSRLAAKFSDEKKGEDISLLNIRRLSSVADYFLIVTADSTVQVNAIKEYIIKSFKETENRTVLHRDGGYSSGWAVLDYGGLIIHIMLPETRRLYSLEKIWSDARKTAWQPSDES